jgi:anti-sigma B factor antagonist
VARADDFELTVEARPEDGATVVRIGGELDMATSPELEEALASADPGHRVVIDLSECTLLDSSAVRVFVATPRAESGDVALVARDPGILRVLEIAAVDTLIPVHETVDSAL